MRPLRALIVEDSEEDTKLLVRALERGYAVTYERVETAEEARAALGREWDVVLCDWMLPRFSAHDALATLKAFSTDLPFIIISGQIGEETAIEALKAGAHDFLVKGRLARLLPAVERELKEAATRKSHREAERSLRESEERFRTLVQSMNDVVLTLDLEGRMTAFYGAWPQSLGFSPQQLIGKTIEEALGPALSTPHRLAEACAFKGESVIYEAGSLPGTKQRHFQTSLAPIRDPLGTVTGLVAIIRETTAVKRLQAQLLASDRMASVGMLAAGIAHEVNNPLATVIANLDLALTRLGPNAEIEELIREARTEADQVRQITGDLKVFSRAEDAGQRPVDVERVIESSLRLADNEVRHRAKVVKAYGHVPPVMGDESRLGTVFLNLVVNAAQTIAEGHQASNEIRVTTSLDSAGRVVIDVADTGKGDVNESSTGLAIVQRLIEMMGGTLSVEAELGRGTVFHVTLPAAVVAPLSDAPVHKAKARSKSTGRRGKVLVIDDEPLLANAIRRLLALEHEVTVVNRAEDALAMVGSGLRFDLILSDLMMPEMTGMELHAHLTAVAADQAAVMVFMTGGVFTKRARDFLETVKNPRFDKPFDSQHLLGLVNERIR